ncbi:MAG: Trk system potassium transporter TrkA [Lachnospiraceae bacterium]|nr:Trk system potassium transporter TrkA [Lachnospiraceae bacterium]
MLNNNIKSGLRIIIVGCGKVGSNLVEQLIKEGHDITVIDKSPAKVQNVTNTYDVMGVVGNGASYSAQMEAGIAKTDLFVAVTGSDELNLLCCTVAKHVGHSVTVARVHTPEYIKEHKYLKEKLGLEMIINPEYEAAKVISAILSLPTAEAVSSFAHGQVEMIRIKLPEDNMICGKRVMDIGRDITSHVVFCAVERGGEVFIPTGPFILNGGDVISFVASRKETRLFLKKIGFRTGQARDTLIVGGGIDSYYLAEMLLRAGTEVKIIENSQEKCKKLSTLLPEAVIINDDGTQEEVLKEAGLETAGSFVPLTGIDEENVLLSLHAKNVSNAKVVTKITRNNFKNILDKMDLGSLIYPKYIISEAIVAYVRAKKNSMNCNIETLYHLFDSKAEAIEFHIEASSGITGISLQDLKLKPNLLIAFINRHGEIIFPGGSDMILPGDNVMIVTTHTGFKDIQDILAKN